MKFNLLEIGHEGADHMVQRRAPVSTRPTLRLPYNPSELIVLSRDRICKTAKSQAVEPYPRGSLFETSRNVNELSLTKIDHAVCTTPSRLKK
jgi:hypothetical protein